MVLIKPTVLACLTATTNALYFSSWTNTDCTGSGWVWSNAVAGVCYSIPAQATSLRWGDIPTSWDIRVLYYLQDGCTGIIAGSGRSNGQTTRCFRNTQYRSSRLQRLNARGEFEDAVVDTGAPCLRPDQLVLEDGARYNLTDLNEEHVETINAGGSSPELETDFAALGI
ncbi:hypothetical protein MN608_08497 [Microdochium nivale]|nr:hypothetical protein MN608_08497 [Microdochium nivale]